MGKSELFKHNKDPLLDGNTIPGAENTKTPLPMLHAMDPLATFHGFSSCLAPK